MKRMSIVLVMAVALSACASGGQASPEVAVAQREAASFGDRRVDDPPGVRVETWVSGLEVPWSLVFMPDGRALVSERPGRIRLIDRGKVRSYAVVDGTVARGEGGLMGLALHPDFPRKPFVYAMHTTASGNRVVRYRHGGDRGVFDRVILDGMPAGGAHNGGRIAFGPDRMLYVAAGETFRGALAQDLESRGGKILRVGPEGEIPRDNPFAGSPVYSYGHRNPQGLAWHGQTMLESEHGPSGEKGWSGHDEVNVIRAGKNYGWPVVIGAPGDARFVDPILYFDEAVPPGNLAFHRGDLFMASLHSGGLVRIVFGWSGATPSVKKVERWFVDRYGRLRDVVAGPDGALYVATSNQDGRGRPRDGDDRILRLTWR